jgi:hypothetical protein
MKYSITNWSIKKLYSTFKAKNLDLSPPYQRNFIWSTEDQQVLVDSINRNIPIPNFFILKKADGKFEMVDGQQRSRTIINFIDKGFTDLGGHSYSATRHKGFLTFTFPVTIITDVEGESIKKFYALVNKTGIHLNKPEVRKADFYETKLLKLVDDIASSKKLLSLKIFTETTLKRMNDKEFISELLILIKDGHVDKKGQIDEYFKKDLTDEQCGDLKRKFNSVLDKVHLLNGYYPINKTRYKQRNDFYTLFDFLFNYTPYNESEAVYFFKLLVLIAGDIKPTQEKCEVLKEYARNCVTQSNSKAAREHRLKFFQNLLTNAKEKPNSTQTEVMKFYDFEDRALKKTGTYHTLNIKELSQQKEIDFLK